MQDLTQIKDFNVWTHTIDDQIGTVLTLSGLKDETEDRIPNCSTESLCCLFREPRYVKIDGIDETFCGTFSSDQNISQYCNSSYDSDSRLDLNSKSRTKPNHIVFECDFKKQVKEALQRVVGIIDKVKSVEVNKIRYLNNTDDCKISTDDGNELVDNYLKDYDGIVKTNLKKLKTDKLAEKNLNPSPCFVIEYLIQVIIGTY